MSSNFESYCETLWKQWITRDLELTPFIEKEFQTEYLPEPYLRFDSESNPLYVLTTNPGRGMPEQHRSNINSQSILVGTEMSYHQIAFRMAAFYLNKLDGSSKRRIDSFIRLSELGGYNSVIQIEACPFHSQSLPKKNVLLEQYKTDPLLKEYGKLVSSLLRYKSVIGLCAVNPNAPIAPASVSRNAWVYWQAKLIGLNLKTAKIFTLTIKNGEPSSAFIYNDDSALKGFVLMKGSNNFPKLDSMGSIIDLLREQNSA